MTHRICLLEDIFPLRESVYVCTSKYTEGFSNDRSVFEIGNIKDLKKYFTERKRRGEKLTSFYEIKVYDGKLIMYLFKKLCKSNLIKDFRTNQYVFDMNLEDIIKTIETIVKHTNNLQEDIFKQL